MIKNLISKYKKINLLKFLIIGFINSFFGYCVGVIIFKFFYQSNGIFFVGITSNILAIFVSFINYKFFYFKSNLNSFFKEMTKSYILYSIIFLINIYTLYIFVEYFKLNIFISQFFVIVIAVFISIFGQFFFVFKKN